MRHVQELRYDGCARDLDQYDVVKADTVERVQESELALDLVGLDHGLEHVADRQGLALTGEMISDGENGTEVVRRVSPWAIPTSIQYDRF